jgi:DNA-binding HxlR family transcriptional regulator
MEEGTSTTPGHTDGTLDAVDAVDGCRIDAFQWDGRQDCDVRQILDRIADKWSLLVIALLSRRTLRFSELRREIDGISQRMLTLTLRNLERDGLVDRVVHPIVPPRVDYSLTDLGCTLLQTIDALVRWTEEHQAEIASARSRYEARVRDDARVT